MFEQKNEPPRSRIPGVLVEKQAKRSLGVIKLAFSPSGPQSIQAQLWINLSLSVEIWSQGVQWVIFHHLPSVARILVTDSMRLFLGSHFSSSLGSSYSLECNTYLPSFFDAAFTLPASRWQSSRFRLNLNLVAQFKEQEYNSAHATQTRRGLQKYYSKNRIGGGGGTKSEAWRTQGQRSPRQNGIENSKMRRKEAHDNAGGDTTHMFPLLGACGARSSVFGVKDQDAGSTCRAGLVVGRETNGPQARRPALGQEHAGNMQATCAATRGARRGTRTEFRGWREKPQTGSEDSPEDAMATHIVDAALTLSHMKSRRVLAESSSRTLAHRESAGGQGANIGGDDEVVVAENPAYYGTSPKKVPVQLRVKPYGTTRQSALFFVSTIFIQRFRSTSDVCVRAQLGHDFARFVLQILTQVQVRNELK
ncbi:hypothetical protein C8R44DRAFT_752589 [Mycena epipterygia]|nr:hypothetical protein C8R44DRAFT_752589 [Mycena epipterygia]